MQDTELQVRLAALAADAGKTLGLTVLVGSATNEGHPPDHSALP